jgi:hypothetical protein
MEHIYVLELAEGKYYVGKTKNSDVRIGQHFEGDGSVWTKKYKPIKVLDVKICFTVFDEDNTTISYMKEKGICNVRGGIYCKIVLSEDEINTIIKTIASIENKCYRCGGNHLLKDCKFQYKPVDNNTKSTKQKEKTFGSVIGSFFKGLVAAFDTESNNTKENGLVVQTSLEKKIKKDNQIKYICDVCNRKCRTKGGLDIHKKEYCQKNNDQIVDGQNDDGQNCDGHNSDGQNCDGQIYDGQIYDGQIYDGQIYDGQIYDGQISDSQISDSQISDSQNDCYQDNGDHINAERIGTITNQINVNQAIETDRTGIDQIYDMKSDQELQEKKRKAWDTNEENMLKRLYIDEHKDIESIAQIHGRTTGAIKSRLEKLNILKKDSNNIPDSGAKKPKYISHNKQKDNEKENKINATACYKCGRNNHYAKDCYAKIHVNGRILN